MSWKYINPGDYRLLNNWDTSYMANVIEPIDHRLVAPHTGCGFYSYSSSGSNNVPSYPIAIPDGIKELWGRFTCFCDYYHSSYWSATESITYFDFWRFVTSSYSTNSNRTLYIKMNKRNLHLIKYNGGSGSSYNYSQFYYSDYNSPKVFEVYFHIKSDQTNGLAEIYLDGKKTNTLTGNVLNGEDIKIERIFTPSTADYFSDIVISDEPIDMNEHAVMVPIKTTTAEGWKKTNDIYTTDSVNKTIWQMPDVDQLKKEIGINNPTITSVSTQAYNISTDDTETVDTLKKQIKQGQTIVDTDSSSITGSTYITSALSINPITNAAWTINDLSNIEFGITTAKSETETEPESE